MCRAGVVWLALALAGCSIEVGALGGETPGGGDGGAVPSDAEVQVDAGRDASSSGTDAGPIPDAGRDASSGAADAGAPDAAVTADAGCTPVIWYRDEDADGYGDGSTGAMGCDPPTAGTWTDTAGDCDDSSGAIHPGAADACNGVDDDCTGLIDDGSACPCAMRRRSGHPYLFCTTGSSWSGARTSCQSVGYDLVVIDGESENAWVWSQASGLSGTGTDWWIGLRDVGGGRYEWVDGSVAWDGGASGWTNFRGSGVPDGSGPCVEMGNDDGGGAWNDVDCAQATDYACEAP